MSNQPIDQTRSPRSIHYNWLGIIFIIFFQVSASYFLCLSRLLEFKISSVYLISDAPFLMLLFFSHGFSLPLWGAQGHLYMYVAHICMCVNYWWGNFHCSLYRHRINVVSVGGVEVKIVEWDLGYFRLV